jgi:uncharacterized protein YraI
MTIARFALAAALALALAGPAAAASVEANGNAPVRDGPGNRYRVIDRLVDGVDYELIECTRQARWCLVAEDGDRLGWVRGGSLIGAAAKLRVTPFESLVEHPPFAFPLPRSF